MIITNKQKRLFLFFILINIQNIAFSVEVKTEYKIIEEEIENSLVRYKVIEYAPELLDDQNRISQRVVYETIGAPSEKLEIEMNLDKIIENDSNQALHKLSISKLSQISQGPLWVPIKQSWTLEDEKDYSKWFIQNVNTRFNRGSNLFADCADVGLLLRWAYAHDKKLPMVNTLSGSGKLFGHFSSSAAWDNLPTHPSWKKDERFKVAMSYLFDNSYTHSIYDDLYPTEINRNFVRPGSLYMIIRKKSGHTQTLYQFRESEAGIRTLWGNEPAGERIFESWLIWEASIKNLFGSWRWPVFEQNRWKLTPAKIMPGYSTEQFEMREELSDEDLFELWVLSKLGMADFDKTKLTREIQIVRDNLQYRLTLTAMGATICGVNPCDTDGSDYDSYSTQSRDARLKKSQIDLLKTVESLGGMQSDIVRSAIKNADIDHDMINGHPLSYKEFIFSTDLMNELDADANRTFAERWGIRGFQNQKMEFAVLNAQLLYTLRERQDLTDSAINYCIKKECNSQDTSIIQLNTSKIDFGLKSLSPKLSELKKSLETAKESTFLRQIQSPYRKIPISEYKGALKSSFCESSSKCTLYDVLWRKDALMRIPKWKSQPTDSATSRWGL